MMEKGPTGEEIKAIMKIIEEAGGAKQIDRGLGRTRRDRRLISQRYRQLRTEVPGKWVVFYRCRPVVVAETHEQAMQICKERNYPIGELVVRHIHPPGEEPTYFLG